MEYLGAWGTLIHEKKLKSKILCQTPFNVGCLTLCFIYSSKLSAAGYLLDKILNY